MCKILQKKHNILNVNDNSFELRFLFQSEIFISLHLYNMRYLQFVRFNGRFNNPNKFAHSNGRIKSFAQTNELNT